MTSSTTPALSLRENPAATSMLIVGGATVIAGGLLSAVTSPLSLDHGSWAAAYLVLVTGVAQIAMGLQRSVHDHHPSSGWLQFVLWNVGSGAVIAGTLISTPLLVEGGSVALVIALVLAFRSTLRFESRNVWMLAYRFLLLVLAVSIPIGILLSHMRH